MELHCHQINYAKTFMDKLETKHFKITNWNLVSGKDLLMMSNTDP